MGQSLSKLYVYLVFSTKHRDPLLLPPLQGSADAYCATVLKNQDSPAVKIGGASDHVHILSGGLVSTPFQGSVSEPPLRGP
jgi:REP element-mobilizing transposase RayT